jgi:hypothetical protein
MKLLDTDILIDHFHGHHAALDFITQQIINRKHYPMADISVFVPYERGR